MVRHHVSGFPSFNHKSTERTEQIQSSVPCVRVSVPGVPPEVEGQPVRGAMCPQFLSKLEQLSRLNEVSTVEDKRPHMETERLSNG